METLPKIDSIALANYILAKAGKMEHLKLQKLLYYMEAYHLAYFDASLIEDDFEAWMHGPVSRKVWHHFKKPAAVYNQVSVTADKAPGYIKTFERTLNPTQQELLQDVLKNYGKDTSYQLECQTHDEAPWIEARDGIAPTDVCREVISKETMKKFYRQYLYPANAKGKASSQA
jgi:uncharacterized phage-associated protein